jgi:hypothetical protein
MQAAAEIAMCNLALYPLLLRNSAFLPLARASGMLCAC